MKDDMSVRVGFWLEFPDLGDITGRCRVLFTVLL